VRQVNTGLLKAALALSRNTDARVRQPQPTPALWQHCPHLTLAAHPGPGELLAPSQASE